jgi:hypothetical protein
MPERGLLREVARVGVLAGCPEAAAAHGCDMARDYHAPRAGDANSDRTRASSTAILSGET